MHFLSGNMWNFHECGDVQIYIYIIIYTIYIYIYNKCIICILFQINKFPWPPSPSTSFQGTFSDERSPVFKCVFVNLLTGGTEILWARCGRIFHGKFEVFPSNFETQIRSQKRDSFHLSPKVYIMKHSLTGLLLLLLILFSPKISQALLKVI